MTLREKGVGLGDRSKRQPHVVIVGAGIAGIATAIRLKADLGFDNFTMYERAESVGGTWRDNTYPGCGCDVPAHWYSLSTDLNPDWQNRYATQPELYAYWQNVWHKHDLDKHTKLNTQVTFAQWDSSRQIYEVSVRDRKTGVEEKLEAAVVIYATGGFQDPKYPPGLDLDVFKGEIFHSARWNHKVELKGKRVAVIGNGCSVAQFVPKIAEDSTVQVINFARTPQWYVPQENHSYPSLVRWVFENVPGVMRAYRNWLMFRSDLSYAIFHRNRGFVVEAARKRLIEYIKMKAPKEYVEYLIPSYAPGCKRMILDPGYLDSLHQPNVSLRFDPLESIVGDGVKLKSGEVVSVDVIIFGTGYELVNAEMKVVGSKGTTIREYFVSKGGPQAYLGACYPGFPNLYTLLGPNVATGHASVIFSHEAQIQQILQLVKPVLDGIAKSFEVTDVATDEYNDWMQKRLANTVWSECKSFYNELDGKKAKNFATFPGPVALFWWFCRSPRWNAFRAVEAKAWERQQSIARYKRWGLWTLLLSTAISLASVVVMA